ncbi:acetyl-CoA hydrolase/transferase C-terminal domain-containing protein [Sphingosinicella sp.]|uniref:acetyl-CoA hydrolase/transferase C-terminal domain-containing protein n=1 Tax=Sphingosinicella sp. TaxID=1917971 RepID=UPI0017A2FBEE|nr:acetyl-CoA hydrolase/transferase C-terminal domain-containing protein [Sphingosinicella sp.]MBA4759204.1 acetyl-CoA hydrolase [Sphingosinicella sp.]
MTARLIGLDDVPDLLRQCERLFLQGTSGEPLALHAVADVQGDAFSHLSALTSFVAGLNRFDRAAPRAVRDVAGFFPAGSGGPEAYRQIVATYSGVVAEIDRFAPDVVFVPVSLPDSSGRVSTGLCAEFYDVAMATASCRVALMCTDLPMLPGGFTFDLDAFTHIVRDDRAPPAWPEGAATPDQVTDAITRHVAGLVGDGSTLQTGIGRIPAGVFAHLAKRRRLRLHSGLLSDPLRALVESGAVDRSVPTCCATLVGSHGFQRWLHERSDIVLRPISYTHAFSTLSAIDGFIAVNSALEIDLFGQVNVEKVDGRHVSARGGLPDFAAAAHRSRGGLSIIALPSTGSGRSRIVPRLAPDVPVSVAGHDVDAVVTEYGVADLRGKDAEARARAIVRVAAPGARRALRAALGA